MGLFKKKPDPISERAKALNDQIAALESQIKKLNAAPESFTPHGSLTGSPAPARPTSTSPPPRLRSTAIPHGPTVTAPSSETVFEETDQRRLHHRGVNVPAPAPDLGTRRFDLAASWERFKTHFRGPSTSNPKLVSYLAAGSIQGLRPMRYEKRVARNRFIVFALILALALWGLLAIFFHSR